MEERGRELVLARLAGPWAPEPGLCPAGSGTPEGVKMGDDTIRHGQKHHPAPGGRAGASSAPGPGPRTPRTSPRMRPRETAGPQRSAT